MAHTTDTEQLLPKEVVGAGIDPIRQIAVHPTVGQRSIVLLFTGHRRKSPGRGLRLRVASTGASAKKNVRTA